MLGMNDPTYEDVVKSVSSIIFLSTPHRGTNLAETLNRILQVSFVSSPMQFIAELSAGSQTIQKLNEQFRHVAPKLQIVSFYETRPTAMLKNAQVVSRFDDVSIRSDPVVDGPRKGIRRFRVSWRDFQGSGRRSPWSV
jgi:hypothetical protein